METSDRRLMREELKPIADKVFSGQRLSFEDGVALYTTSDLHTVGALANWVREKWNGNVGYFNVNRHLNPTNVCVVDCKFCGFARKPNKGGYTMSLEEAYHHASQGYSEAVTELHIVGGSSSLSAILLFHRPFARAERALPEGPSESLHHGRVGFSGAAGQAVGRRYDSSAEGSRHG